MGNDGTTGWEGREGGGGLPQSVFPRPPCFILLLIFMYFMLWRCDDNDNEHAIVDQQQELLRSGDSARYQSDAAERGLQLQISCAEKKRARV